MGSQFFLNMCLPFVSLLVSALFRWPCSISIHLSPRSVTAGVRPFPLAMQHFYSFQKQFTVRGSQFFLKMCPPFLSLLALFRWPCSISLSSFCLPLSPVFSSFLLVTVSALSPFCFLLSPFLSPFLLVIVSTLSPFCFLYLRSCLPSCCLVCPSCLLVFLFVSLLVSFLVGHCVRLV